MLHADELLTPPHEANFSFDLKLNWEAAKWVARHFTRLFRLSEMNEKIVFSHNNFQGISLLLSRLEDHFNVWLPFHRVLNFILQPLPAACCSRFHKINNKQQRHTRQQQVEWGNFFHFPYVEWKNSENTLVPRKTQNHDDDWTSSS